MPRSQFRAYQVLPGFHEGSTTLGLTGAWQPDGGLAGLCLSRVKNSPEGVYLSYHMGACEHEAAFCQVNLTRTQLCLKLAPASAQAMEGVEEFQVRLVLTDPEFDRLAAALSAIFDGLPCYTSPKPVRHDS